MITKSKSLTKVLIALGTVILIAIAAIVTTVGLTGQSKDRKLQMQLDLGNKYLTEGQYEDAVVAFEAAISIEPKTPEAYKGLAEAYEAMGDYEAAKEALQRGIEATADEGLKDYKETIEEEQKKQEAEKAAEAEARRQEEERKRAQDKYSNGELSLFLTNYLKYSKNDFDVEHIDYLTILSYVYAYVEDKAADAVEIVGTGEWIPKNLVDSIAEETYGCDVPEQDYDYVTFSEDGFLYPAMGLPGSWGIEYAIIDSVTEENGIYQIAFLDTYYMGAEGKTDEELKAIYDYTTDQVRENNDFEIRGTVSCTLKNDGMNLLMQKIIYTPMLESNENTAMSATELVMQEVPELQELFQKIYELSSQQAGVSLWEDEQQLYDSNGNMYDCTLVYVGEDWPEHVQVVYIFAVDKNTNQVYWYDLENDYLTGIDSWREAAAYWFQ